MANPIKVVKTVLELLKPDPKLVALVGKPTLKKIVERQALPIVSKGGTTNKEFLKHKLEKELKLVVKERNLRRERVKIDTRVSQSSRKNRTPIKTKEKTDPAKDLYDRYKGISKSEMPVTKSRITPEQAKEAMIARRVAAKKTRKEAQKIKVNPKRPKITSAKKSRTFTRAELDARKAKEYDKTDRANQPSIDTREPAIVRQQAETMQVRGKTVVTKFGTKRRIAGGTKLAGADTKSASAKAEQEAQRTVSEALKSKTDKVKGFKPSGKTLTVEQAKKKSTAARERTRVRAIREEAANAPSTPKTQEVEQLVQRARVKGALIKAKKKAPLPKRK